MSHDYLGGLSSCGVRAAGRSRSRLAFGHDVEAPAAALLPASRTSRIPEIPPVGRRYADFSDTLQICLIRHATGWKRPKSCQMHSVFFGRTSSDHASRSASFLPSHPRRSTPRRRFASASAATLIRILPMLPVADRRSSGRSEAPTFCNTEMLGTATRAGLTRLKRKSCRRRSRTERYRTYGGTHVFASKPDGAPASQRRMACRKDDLFIASHQKHFMELNQRTGRKLFRPCPRTASRLRVAIQLLDLDRRGAAAAGDILGSFQIVDRGK